MDRSSWAALGDEQVVRAQLASVAARHSLRLHLVLTGFTEPGRDRLERELSRAGTAAAVIGPFFSGEAISLAAAHPAVTFCLLGPDTDATSPPNVGRLLFDRTEALATAGYAAAISLRAGGKGKAGILLSGRHTPGGDEEVGAFLRGLADAGAQPPLVRELAEPVDRTAAVRAVAEMARDGVAIFFPRLGWQNLACLEALKNTGGCAVTEDWQASGVFAGQVFLSVEDDIIGGVDASLSAGSSREIRGGVRIVCGKARPVPPGMGDRIQCR
jgi:basic membrane lipoprotein Med (substrate-binding protein (PBP1-ABC) superfamily)